MSGEAKTAGFSAAFSIYCATLVLCLLGTNRKRTLKIGIPYDTDVAFCTLPVSNDMYPFSCITVSCLRCYLASGNIFFYLNFIILLQLTIAFYYIQDIILAGELLFSWMRSLLLFRIPVKECARTLWMGAPFWGRGDRIPKAGTRSVCWAQIREGTRRDRMRRRQEVKENDPFMASRCQHAQSTVGALSITRVFRIPFFVSAAN